MGKFYNIIWFFSSHYSSSIISFGISNSKSSQCCPRVNSISPFPSLPPHLNSSFPFPSKQSSPPQKLTEIPSPPKKQEFIPPPPPQKIAKPFELQSTSPLAFPNPCWEDKNQNANQGKQQQKEEPNKDEEIQSLKSWALKFGITKIPLMVKPIEDVEVGEQVENKADFITAVKREK